MILQIRMSGSYHFPLAECRYLQDLSHHTRDMTTFLQTSTVNTNQFVCVCVLMLFGSNTLRTDLLLWISAVQTRGTPPCMSCFATVEKEERAFLGKI